MRRAGIEKFQNKFAGGQLRQLAEAGEEEDQEVAALAGCTRAAA